MMFTVLIVSNVVLWLAVLGLAFLLLGALRAHGILAWKLEELEATTPNRVGRTGLKPGKAAPEFTLPKVSGGEVSLRDFAGRPTLLVFVQAGCGPCHAIAPELNTLARKNDLQASWAIPHLSTSSHVSALLITAQTAIVRISRRR